MRTAAAVIVWFASALGLSLAGVFEQVPSGVLLLVGLVVPSALYFLLFALSEQVREFMAGLNLRYLTMAEAGRILGGTYILFDPKLPELFALPTGISDVVVGASALLAARYLVSNEGEPKRGIWAWHAFGLFWLVVSITTGILTSPPPFGGLVTDKTSQAMSAFPLSLIPTFLGPMVIQFHVIALTTARLRTTSSHG